MAQIVVALIDAKSTFPVLAATILVSWTECTPVVGLTSKFFLLLLLLLVLLPL